MKNEQVLMILELHEYTSRSAELRRNSESSEIRKVYRSARSVSYICHTVNIVVIPSKGGRSNDKEDRP